MKKIGLFSNFIFYHNCSCLPSDKFVVPCLFSMASCDTAPIHSIFPYCVNKQGITNIIFSLHSSCLVQQVHLLLPYDVNFSGLTITQAQNDVKLWSCKWSVVQLNSATLCQRWIKWFLPQKQSFRLKTPLYRPNPITSMRWFPQFSLSSTPAFCKTFAEFFRQIFYSIKTKRTNQHY